MEPQNPRPPGHPRQGPIDLLPLLSTRLGAAADEETALSQPASLGASTRSKREDTEAEDCLSQAATLPPGAEPMPQGRPIIAGFEVLGELGRGGMGVVYKARQVGLGRLVAIKMLLGRGEASAEALARFRTEAEAVARLQHPNIVQVHAVGEAEGRPYVVLEYVPGGSLRDKLRGTPLPEREAAETVRVLAEAIHYAHQRGIIHRDLKPANVLLAPEPKVADFGLAKHLDRNDGQTHSGAILGTPSYMAPEQAGGVVRRITPSTDVYALGVILYELLTGRPPFVAESTLETVLLVLNEEPIAPSRLRPRVPRDLETICLKCLHKEWGRRYASAQALAEDLERFLAGRPIQARPAKMWERAAKWARRRPALAGLVLVSVLASLALVSVISWFNVRLRTERDEAEDNFRTTLDAVDEIFAEVGASDLDDEQYLDDRQRKLLEMSVKYYRRLLDKKSADPGMRRRSGLAAKKIADSLRLLGRTEEAGAAYTEAIALLDRLADEFPGEPEFRERLADAWNWQGELLRTNGHPQEARECFEKAQALQSALVAEFPEAPEYEMELARTHDNLGLLLLARANQPSQARKEFEEALMRMQRILGRQPNEARYRQHLARASDHLGTVLHAINEDAAAKEAQLRAIALFDELRKEHPERLAYRHELGVACGNLGRLLDALGDRTGAGQNYARAEALLRELAGNYPHYPVYRSDLANVRNSQGMAAARDQKWGAARACWEEARDLWALLVAQFPAVPQYRSDLGMVLYNLGLLAFKQDDLGTARTHLEKGLEQLQAALCQSAEQSDAQLGLRRLLRTLADTLVRQGAHEAALERAQALAEGPLGAENNHVLALCFLARCVKGAEGLRADSTSGMPSWAERYTACARTLLKDALSKGVPGLQRLKDDRDFEPLRQVEEFRLLLESLPAPTG